MQIYEGAELEAYKTEYLKIQSSWNKRNFVKLVENYLNGKTEKIFAVGGLSGTGKTVGILQAAVGHDAAYLTTQKNDGKTGRDYIDFLKTTNKRVVIIDEYSWIEDREQLDGYLLTAVQNGKRIVITAMESISLDFLKFGALNRRVQTVHTTMFTYEEYLRLYNKEQNESSCIDFLMKGGLFKNLKSFDSARNYIDEAIVKNLADYLKNEMDEEKARILTYAVLYKAICPPNLSPIATLRKGGVTMRNYLKHMGVNTPYIPESKEVERVADIFEQAGIIVRIPNFDTKSKLQERYYITNPSLTYRLIKEFYGMNYSENFILGQVFEASVAVRLFTNMLSEHKIYFYNNGEERENPDNGELNIIITDKEKDFAYLFECKFKQNDLNDSDVASLYGCLEEHEFQDMEVEGRYVVYNGKAVAKDYETGTVIFTPIGDILDNYFEFDENVKTLMLLNLL